MLRRRHETLQEQALREASAAGGIAGPVPVGGSPSRVGPPGRGRATALSVVGWIWLVLGAAFTLWGVWDYNHSELRTVTIARVATIPTVGGDGLRLSALVSQPSGRWSGDCPPGAVVGQEVELFINPDGMVWDSPGSMVAVIAVSGTVTVLGALVLLGLGWFPRRTPHARRGPAGPRFGS